MAYEEGLSFLDTSFSEDYFSDIDEACIKDIQAKVKKDIHKICKKNRSSFKKKKPPHLKNTKQSSGALETPNFSPLRRRSSDSGMLEEKIPTSHSPSSPKTLSLDSHSLTLGDPDPLSP
jgi:hypothetical protein